MSTQKQDTNGRIIQFIRLKSSLAEEEVYQKAKEREPDFQAIPGLLQKYYVKLGAPGEFGGIYVWDSRESLAAYRASDLAATIPQAYQLTEAPNIEVMDLLFQLRE